MLHKSFHLLAGSFPPGRDQRLPEEAVAEIRHSISTMERTSHRVLWFAALCCFIGIVSVHDAYLLVHNRQDILEFEQNPIGRWLIEAGGGDVILFVAVKLTTTAFVCSFLISRYRRRPQQTHLIATGVAAFQFGLLLYLMGAWK